MTPDTARRVRDLLLECSAKLDASAMLVRQECSDDEFRRHRKVVGELMGMIYLDLLRQIFIEHPELEPESLKTSRT